MLKSHNLIIKQHLALFEYCHLTEGGLFLGGGGGGGEEGL